MSIDETKLNNFLGKAVGDLGGFSRFRRAAENPVNFELKHVHRRPDVVGVPTRRQNSCHREPGFPGVAAGSLHNSR